MDVSNQPGREENEVPAGAIDAAQGMACQRDMSSQSYRRPFTDLVRTPNPQPTVCLNQENVRPENPRGV
jgi:hypothetical protein